jgi:hypothetical protein
MADDFTRQKFAWLDQIATDPSVSAQAFRAGYFIACRFLNRGTGDAFPSQDTLARLIGLTTSKGVRYLIDQLVDGGHLGVTAAHGRGRTNRYRLILKGGDITPDVVERSGAPPRDNDGIGTDAATDLRDTLFPEPDRDEPAPQPAVSDASLDLAFETWWEQYPKKVAKAAARKAYERIVRSSVAAPQELFAGVMRYAAQRTDQDPQFTKHPGTWLNGACWTDEPDQPRSDAFNDRPPSGFQRQAPLSHLEVALAGLTRDE